MESFFNYIKSWVFYKKEDDLTVAFQDLEKEEKKLEDGLQELREVTAKIEATTLITR